MKFKEFEIEEHGVDNIALLWDEYVSLLALICMTFDEEMIWCSQVCIHQNPTYNNMKKTCLFVINNYICKCKNWGWVCKCERDSYLRGRFFEIKWVWVLYWVKVRNLNNI